MMSNKREGKYFQNGSSLFFSEKMAGSDCQGVEACGAGLFLSRWRIFFFFFGNTVRGGLGGRGLFKSAARARDKRKPTRHSATL